VHEELTWSAEAKQAFDELIEDEPVLVRISAAKTLRDATERAARKDGLREVTRELLPRRSARAKHAEPA
ncbi:MAG: chlorophyllide reductase subunit Z, partial [Burkholderiales bacterium]